MERKIINETIIGRGGVFILRRNWMIQAGRCFYSRRDMRVSIGLGYRDAADEGEIPWRVYLSVAWNWRPKIDRIQWQTIPFIPGDPVGAVVWTGRDIEVVRWSWPHSVYGWWR